MIDNKYLTADIARELAREYQELSSELSYSYYTIADYQEFFRDLAEQFDLVDEFTENGIL